MKQSDSSVIYPFRRKLIISFFVIVSGLLAWRAIHLQVLNREYLRGKGDAKSLHVIDIPAHRGMITDRNNEPLAISTPVESIMANPKQVLSRPEFIPALAKMLDMESVSLIQLLKERYGRNAIYLKRRALPEQAQAIMNLSVPGVSQKQEFKRYYPAGEVIAQLIGFTNIDDTGQEGVELAYETWLKGVPGEKQVLKDRLGRVVKDVESIKPSNPGKTLALSIDKRVQYLAYRELASAVRANHARSGSAVMLDSKTGEVIAVAVYPSYNPNNRTGVKSEHFRNRAITDVFEPGSTLKPFTMAAALMSGMFDMKTIIDTNPGQLKVSYHTIRDVHNYGVLDLTGIIQKSSNVGAAKIALALGSKPLWQVLQDVGFGVQTSSGFPGESPGRLYNYANWTELDLASVAFGHSMAVTTLQLAQGYSVIASGGILHPVTFQKAVAADPGTRVLPEEICAKIMTMLEKVVEPGGTAQRANVPLYRVAGKTGTAHKSTSSGYSEDKYLSLFAGMAPVSDPQLVLVVVIDEPQGGEYFGGLVAAPVYSSVMQGALRILDIAPDKIPDIKTTLLMADKATQIQPKTR